MKFKELTSKDRFVIASNFSRKIQSAVLYRKLPYAVKDPFTNEDANAVIESDCKLIFIQSDKEVIKII